MMYTLLRAIGLCSASLVTLAIASTAVAQNGAPAPTADGTQAATGAVNAGAAALPAASTEDNIITVVGTRLGLGSSTEVKRNSLQSLSSLSTEDLAKIPDTSIADTLRRVPGVVVNQSGGGGIPTIRGLRDSEYRLNGRNLTSTVGRGYDTAAIPADLVSGIDVFKTPSASQIEGGIGGVFDFKTRRPMDFQGLAGSLTAKAGYSDLSRKVRPYLSGFLSDRWDTPLGEIGLLAGGAYQRRDTTQNVARSDSNGPVVDSSGQTKTQPTNLIKRQFFGGQSIESAFVSGQWRPDERFELTADLLYNNEGLNFKNQSLTAQLAQGTPVGLLETYADSNAVRSGTYANVPLESNGNHGRGYFRTYQAALSGRYHQGRLTLSGDASYTKTIFRYEAPSVTIRTIAPSVVMDSGVSIPRFTVAGVDQTSSAPWSYTNFSDYVARDFSTEHAYRGDAIYDVGGILKNIQIGVRHVTRDVGHQQNILNAALTPGVPLSGGPDFGLSRSGLWSDSYPQRRWVTPLNVFPNNDALKTLFGFPTGRPAYDPNQSYSAKEKVLAGYAQATFAFPVGGIPVDGNVGVRVAQTKLNIVGVQSLQGGGSAPIDASQQFTDALPMVNVRAELARQLYLRAAFSKAITRAAFFNLNPSLTLDFVNRTGNAGNPNLRPLRADQYDVSAEWYFAKDSLLYAAGFYKDLSGYVRNLTSPETINGQQYLIGRPQNVDSSWLVGFELGYTHQFKFLPGALSGLGFNGSYTYIRDKRTANPAGFRVGLEQLSSNNYSLGLTYDLDGFNGSLAYTRRGRILEATTGDPSGRPLYNKPYGQLDLNLSYEVTPNVNMLFNVVNLTQNRQTQTFLNRDYFNQTFREDRRIFLGAQVKFGKPGR